MQFIYSKVMLFITFGYHTCIFFFSFLLRRGGQFPESLFLLFHSLTCLGIREASIRLIMLNVKMYAIWITYALSWPK